MKLGCPEGLGAGRASHFDFGTGVATSESSLTQPFPHFFPDSTVEWWVPFGLAWTGYPAPGQWKAKPLKSHRLINEEDEEEVIPQGNT